MTTKKSPCTVQIQFLNDKEEAEWMGFTAMLSEEEIRELEEI